ncbi:hypothetical protein ACFFX0_09100 [Citricoccus parietis]|uniref:Uncharacterized protein n=1 Tax=Citricoccus parietis TaxID=592307 RepID=A0ABV5FXC1_9MICC
MPPAGPSCRCVPVRHGGWRNGRCRQTGPVPPGGRAVLRRPGQGIPRPVRTERPGTRPAVVRRAARAWPPPRTAAR